MDAQLRAKIDNAHEANQAVKRYLEASGRNSWVECFDWIEHTLSAADPKAIQRARGQIPQPKEGGFTDILDMDDELRVRFYLLDRALGNIKLWHRYQANRPLVDLSDQTVEKLVADKLQRRERLRKQFRTDRKPWWFRILAKLTGGS